MNHNLITDFTILKVTGPDAATFLQGQLTCDIKKLSATQSSLGALCDHKGRMLATFIIWHSQAAYYLLLPQDILNSTQQALQKYAVFSQATLSEWQASWSAITLSGDDAATVINSLPTESNSPQLPKDTMAMSISDSDWVIIRLPDATPRYLIIGTQSQLLPWYQSLSQEPSTKPSEYTSNNLFNQENIAARLVFLHTETQGQFTPQMFGLEQVGGVSFNKGCYIGQEIIVRTQHLGKLKRHLHHCYLTTQQAPHIGNSLNNEQGSAVGTIVAVAKTQTNQYEMLAVIQNHAIEQPLFWKQIAIILSSD